MPPSLSEIEDLNRRFAIPGVAGVVAGEGGLAKVWITTAAASAEIYLHGAQITSWKPAAQQDILFLSPHSRWEEGRAIRGGIPVCFPWFRAKADNSQAPAHGVVRTRAWTLTAIERLGDAVAVALETESDAATRRWWPYAFRLVHRITVGAELKLELTTINTGDTPLRLEEALHTYHHVGDVRQARIAGLDGSVFLDNTAGNTEKIQLGDVVMTQATDNAYLNTGSALELVDPVLERRVRIEKANSLTTVVWNPWGEGAKALADLGDEEWPQFACVEASNILSAALEVAPGAEHTMGATIRVHEPAYS